MDDVELLPGNGTALGLAGPRAAERLERLGQPADAELMSSIHAEWKGQPVRIPRAYGAFMPHYRNMGAGGSDFRAVEGAGGGWRDPGGSSHAGGLSHRRRDSRLRHRHCRARPAPGDLADAHLNFNKGCYLGQEIVERIRSRGSVHRHLRPLELPELSRCGR